MLYYGKTKSRRVTIGDQTIIVDSYLEEKVIRRLEANGFSGRWHKPPVGLNVGGNNYTPDLELSIQEGEMTHRALVEIKPAKRYFTAYISRRMRGVVGHYLTQVVLLYADKENSWYRVDIKTGALEMCDAPIPGRILVAKLYKPLAIAAPQIYDHRYKTGAVAAVGSKALGLVADVVSAIFVGPKKVKRRFRKKY